ncbi:GntR family transcriptional regulator [Saccharopolyspora phatthalungensis]|uniref:DNA-binding GntR family transcriptional regulator n=1 Tax=Saccharopolyspora phatthalungensis TaxID=664693 RepID=A0A840Q9P5_9PSEU|nr:GntR family transcriptional regulator [Saccharopolyspora phatthalungensis]MBB5157156.1 DNA-binding GntR family transcriptional regulator [Saccharopolyspora phatthalungensis]
MAEQRPGRTDGGKIAATSTSMQRLSLSEQALAVLRQAMVSGEIQPGEIYSAAALASQLGVSSSPVREAMLTLVNEGLMVPVRNRGYQVVPISASELEEIQRIRILLEVPTMVEVASRHAELDLAPYAGIAQEIVDAAHEGDITGYLERDRDFHLGLIGLAGNARLTKMVGTLRDHTRLFGLKGLNEQGQLIASAKEHLEIIAAMQSGDTAKTEQLMSVHLGHITHEWSGEGGQPASDDADER